MAHGGYDRRRVAERRPVSSHRSKLLAVDKKPKPVSLKRQIRSTERLLRKDVRPEVREALKEKLDGLKKQQEIHSHLAVERKIFMRDRKIKFFERRKIERSIRRLEKQQRVSSGQTQEADVAEQLSKLKEDLEYIRFFPKNEKYVSLFKGDNVDIIDRRNSLRKQIKDNIITAAASGKDLEETASEDDFVDLSEDDFFLSGSSSDEAEADDEWTDKSAREQVSSASGKAASGMSSDERTQRQISARALMPPPRPSKNLVSIKSRHEGSTSKKPFAWRAVVYTSSNTSNSTSDGSSFRRNRPLGRQTGHSSNLSSNSDARKPRRKRRHKKKKQQA